MCECVGVSIRVLVAIRDMYLAVQQCEYAVEESMCTSLIIASLIIAFWEF